MRYREFKKLTESPGIHKSLIYTHPTDLFEVFLEIPKKADPGHVYIEGIDAPCDYSDHDLERETTGPFNFRADVITGKWEVTWQEDHEDQSLFVEPDSQEQVVVEVIDTLRSRFGTRYEDWADEMYGGFGIDIDETLEHEYDPERSRPLTPRESEQLIELTEKWNWDWDLEYNPYIEFRKKIGHLFHIDALDHIDEMLRVCGMWDEDQVAHWGHSIKFPDQDNVNSFLGLVRDEAEGGFDISEGLTETVQDEGALRDIAQLMVQWFLKNLETIRQGQIGGGTVKATRTIGTIESMTGYLKKFKKKKQIGDVTGMDAVSLENIVKDTRVFILHPLPDDSEGAYNDDSKILLLDLDIIKTSPPKIESTIIHELRHALDLSKSKGKFNSKDDQKDYPFRPLEINARFSQALDDIRKLQAKHPEKHKLMDIIKYALMQHNIRQIFPRGLKSPRYKRLISRIYQQLEYDRGR